MGRGDGHGATDTAGAGEAGVPSWTTRACLVLEAGAWFARDDFQAWARRNGVATWGDRGPVGPGGAAAAAARGEYDCADIFTNFDGVRVLADGSVTWEGSDVADHGGAAAADVVGRLPVDIYRAIGRVLLASGARHGVLWLQPIE